MPAHGRPPISKSEAASLVAAGRVVEIFDHATLGVFDVSWLRRLVAGLAERGGRPLSCSFADVRAEDGSADPYVFITSQREIDRARVRELTDAQLEDPLIFLLCPPGTNGDGETHLLVDGIHRLVARRERGLKDFRFWLVPLAAARRFDKASATEIPWGEKEVRDGELIKRR